MTDESQAFLQRLKEGGGLMEKDSASGMSFLILLVGRSTLTTVMLLATVTTRSVRMWQY